MYMLLTDGGVSTRSVQLFPNDSKTTLRNLKKQQIPRAVLSTHGKGLTDATNTLCPLCFKLETSQKSLSTVLARQNPFEESIVQPHLFRLP